MGLIGLFTQTLLSIRFVLTVVSLEPNHLAVTFKGKDVGRNPVEKPAVMAADHCAAGEIFQAFFQ